MPICGDSTSLVRVIRSDGEMGNVDDEYADSMLTSPGRLMAVGAAGALNAPTADGVMTTRAVNKVVVAVRMVFMVVLSLRLSELWTATLTHCSSSQHNML